MDPFKTILTKYWVGILCGVIALLAMIATIFPLGGYHDELRQKLKGSAGTYGTLQGLTTQTRLKPKLFDKPEQEELGQFPSQSIIDTGKLLVGRLESESKNAMKAVVDTNRHDPLIPGVLPNPTNNAPFQYREAYIRRLNYIDGTLVTQTLKAGMPPTREQIDAEKKRQWEQKYEPQILRDGSGQALNEPDIKRQYEDAMLKLPQEMRSAAASASKIYMDDKAIAMEATVANKNIRPPTPDLIWWSQLALWVQEDVAKAIEEANAGAANVAKSRVKRLHAISVAIGPTMLFGNKAAAAAGGMAGMGGMGRPDPAVPVPGSNPNDPVVLDTKVSPSGRTSCGLYDVVQFRVDMVVSARELPAVLATFSNNRLIAVLNVEKLEAEDGALAAREGFLYGPESVVRVVLKCEALFLREWTVPLMPESIKNLLSIQPPPVNTI